MSERGVHVAAIGELETRPSDPPRAVHVIPVPAVKQTRVGEKLFNFAHRPLARAVHLPWKRGGGGCLVECRMMTLG